MKAQTPTKIMHDWRVMPAGFEPASSKEEEIVRVIVDMTYKLMH